MNKKFFGFFRFMANILLILLAYGAVGSDDAFAAEADEEAAEELCTNFLLMTYRAAKSDKYLKKLYEKDDCLVFDARAAKIKIRDRVTKSGGVLICIGTPQGGIQAIPIWLHRGSEPAESAEEIAKSIVEAVGLNYVVQQDGKTILIKKRGRGPKFLLGYLLGMDGSAKGLVISMKRS